MWVRMLWLLCDECEVFFCGECVLVCDVWMVCVLLGVGLSVSDDDDEVMCGCVW